MPHHHVGGSLTRRNVLRIGAAGAAGAAAATLGGCGGTVFGAADQVRYWNLFSGGDGERMQRMEAAYRTAHPETNLEAVTLTWGAPYYTKLAMAAAGGRAPEVGALHLTRLASMAPGRLLDPFDEDLLADVGVRRQDFPEHLVERASVGGELYAVPLDVHGLVLYVNREVVRPTGLLDSADRLAEFRGPADFLNALDEIHTATGEIALATANDPSSLWRLFWTFYRQLGGDIQLPVGERVQYDRDAMVEVMEFFLEVFDGNRASATLDYDAGVAAFQNGIAGLQLNGSWELPSYADALETTGSPDFTMLPVPAVLGPEPAVWVDSHALVLPHQDSRDDAGDRRAYEFIATLLENGLVWASGGHIPVYEPVSASDEYRSLEPQSNYRSTAADGELDPEAWFAGAGSDFHNQMGQVLNAVFTRSMSPDDGISQWERAMNQLLSTPSPV
ncbi:extracellular solute-binding protein [Phytoactinopolyspora halotolerans]|uniref:Extracellular solute-binding protein n=1 Tax=Phytoactinopolyspora halotolerans TaxID=1981512 RepID=A0A6L9SIX8_9ACTN|nr:extracellular solute-binding protein [Phytoactinopolyspora halotolerans]NEE04634.1 extracellular solute-binding protein [Phytoactinopolyspora halotolerans]